MCCPDKDSPIRHPHHIDSDLYVISTVFNSRRFQSRERLYRNFATWLERCGVKLLTVEIAFGERAFQLTERDNPWHVQLRTSDELWHKERAINVGMQYLSQLVPEWRYVAWMDPDIKLLRDDWARETVQHLQHYSIAQLFSEAVSLGPNHEILFSCPSIAANFVKHGSIDWGDNPGLKNVSKRVPGQGYFSRRGHPGLGWAFRRDVLDEIGGWLDICINGSGDLHMAACFCGDWTIGMPAGMSPGYKAAVRRYAELCDRFVRRNVGCLPGPAVHYWHGKSSERGYDTRWKLLVEHDFDPVEDLRVDTQGLYRWVGNKLDLEYETRRSISKRNEDSIDL